ncbi:CFI-box-CTERM domain-containing protein [Ruegeria arenilitoris]|uniref:CFI-box-CTERM domain-containing protein n=1 Tax=Ruegeria arenilitoris TaxID=1173585 RepID=UPI001480FE6C|nr:CFI-box-CTERM domain-containing protein [Ruegeria arenilitoris]
MGDYEDTFHPDGTDGDDVEEMPSQGGWFGGSDDDEDDKRRKKEQGGWCFLTTAACEKNGLPDDCYELQTLRDFRDNFLCNSAEGTELVEEYYRIAPSLVPLVKEGPLATWAWERIKMTVSQIEEGKTAAAIETYREMVRVLQKSEESTQV